MLLGASLGVLALATITHLLVTSVRRRRRDLAVLRAIGFTRGQVRTTVAGQADHPDRGRAQRPASRPGWCAAGWPGGSSVGSSASCR